MSQEEREAMLAAIEREPALAGHLGRHALARLASDEQDPQASAHVAECASCATRLETLRNERRAFLVQRPFGALEGALEDKKPQASWWPVWSGLLVAAAAALFLTARPPATVVASAPETRVKAAAGLTFHVRSGDEVRVGATGETVHPGDAIQLRYTSPQAAHLVVVSMDNAGAVTAFYDDRGRSLGVQPGVAQLLDGSVVLDDALGPERVIGCFSDTPLDTDAVVAAGRRALTAAGGDPRRVERLELDCKQVGFVLNKAPPQ